MARLHASDDSSDELPDLDDFIRKHVKIQRNTRKALAQFATERQHEKTTARKQDSRSTGLQQSSQESTSSSNTSLPRTSTKRAAKSSSKRTAAASTSGVLQPEQGQSNPATKTRATPHRRAKKVAQSVLPATTEEGDEESEFEESIWCDKSEDSEADSLPDIDPRVLNLIAKKQWTPDTELSNPVDTFGTQSSQDGPFVKKSEAVKGEAALLDLPDRTSDKENDGPAFLRFSPPRQLSPAKAIFAERPATPPPPASPSKSKLVSPSKKKLRIPTPPHRQSIDTFWNLGAVNEWNDHHSPQKIVASPRKNRYMRAEETVSPSESPRKSQSPTKRTRAEIDAKKDFDTRKVELCEDFFAELDEKVTEGKIKELASSTGGVRFIWSKTLNSTAGRANWKRETSKVRNLDGTTDVSYRHHASIELADKVIDDEERLLNVIAHEFCHLANFMVSGIKDQPHGRQFKIWGAKCTRAFGHRGIEVTTKHSYQIDYKYIWACSNELCGYEYKRHSKSIDPVRHTCGVCRGQLEQIKPVPRKKAGATGYATFVKENFAALKQEMGGASHKEVMTALGQRYRDQKAAAVGPEVDDMAKALESMALGGS